MLDDYPKLTVLILVAVLVIQVIYSTATGLWLVAQFGFPITSAFLIFVIGFAFLGAVGKVIAEIISIVASVIILMRS